MMEALITIQVILIVFQIYFLVKIVSEVWAERFIKMFFLNHLAYWLTIEPRLNELKKLLPEAKIHPAGSRYVCNPPEMLTDIDFLVYAESSVDDALTTAGYVKTQFKEYNGIFDNASAFQPWRKGKVNLIVTSSVRYAETFQTGTYICKANNVLNKFDRILIHEAVRGSMEPDTINQLDLARLDPLKKLLISFNGTHGNAILKAYRAKHGLVL